MAGYEVVFLVPVRLHVPDAIAPDAAILAARNRLLAEVGPVSGYEMTVIEALPVHTPDQR